jgi:transposase-like protein
MKLDLNKIRVDGGTQPRAKLSVELMEEYADEMRNGVEFRPITVFFDGTDYWLADGFHRVGAALRARPDDPIEAEVIQGTLSDAQWYSYAANKTHGQRRNNDDKARAARAALRHSNAAGLSNGEIAGHCGVSAETVRKYRAELESTSKNWKSDQSTSQTPESDAATTDIPQSDDKPRQSPEPSEQSTPSGRPRKGRDGRTIDTANIGKGPRKKANRKKQGVSISRNAHMPKLGHSAPCPMIPLQFSPNNPQTAAATLWQHFSRSFLETLIQELSKRLSAQGEAA